MFVYFNGHRAKTQDERRETEVTEQIIFWIHKTKSVHVLYKTEIL